MISSIPQAPIQLVQPLRIEVEHVRVIRTHKIIKSKTATPNVRHYTKSEKLEVGDILELEESTDNSAYKVNIIDSNNQQFLISIPDDNVLQN